MCVVFAFFRHCSLTWPVYYTYSKPIFRLFIKFKFVVQTICAVELRFSKTTPDAWPERASAECHFVCTPPNSFDTNICRENVRNNGCVHCTQFCRTANSDDARRSCSPSRRVARSARFSVLLGARRSKRNVDTSGSDGIGQHPVVHKVWIGLHLYDVTESCGWRVVGGRFGEVGDDCVDKHREQHTYVQIREEDHT